MGSSTREETIALLGRPDEIVPLKQDLAGNDAWIYYEGEGHQRAQRLGLVVDQKSGIVLSAVWSLRNGEPLNEKSAAISHFRDSHFTSKEVGSTSSHSYSDDTIYQDRAKGVSLYIGGARKTVESISFGTPNVKARAPGNR